MPTNPSKILGIFPGKGFAYSARKLFKDVFDDDLILSLNPTNRTPEWVESTNRQCYRYNGDMIHFFNKSLDCLVTPEHNMVYLNKNDGRIKNCQAKEYTKGKGAFYRGCEYESEDVAFYEIDNIKIPFDLFCVLFSLAVLYPAIILV